MNKFLDDEKFLESPFQLTLEDFKRLEVLKENISEEEQEEAPRLIKRLKPCFYYELFEYAEEIVSVACCHPHEVSNFTKETEFLEKLSVQIYGGKEEGNSWSGEDYYVFLKAQEIEVELELELELDVSLWKQGKSKTFLWRTVS